MPRALTLTLLALALLCRMDAAHAVTAGIGMGSPVERIAVGYMLGLVGVLPATGAVFAVLNVLCCHPARSKWLQALGGAVLGCIAYVLCVLVGSLSLGFLLDEDKLLEGYARYGETGFWVLVFVVLYLPALPIALWSMLHAHSVPKALRRRGQA